MSTNIQRQIIKTNVGIEQDVLLSYSDLILRFEFRFNDYFNSWFFNVINDTTNVPIIYGIKMVVGKDALDGLGLNLGQLFLIDTVNDGSSYDIKNDFGDRLKLERIYAVQT